MKQKPTTQLDLLLSARRAALATMVAKGNHAVETTKMQAFAEDGVDPRDYDDWNLQFQDERNRLINLATAPIASARLDAATDEQKGGE